MATSTHKFDHVVSVMFENRSFDNLLGYLYEPGEVESFEGVAGRDLSNPIPAVCAERRACAWCRPSGRDHGYARTRSGRGVPARQHAALRRRSTPAEQPVAVGRGDGGAVQRPADDHDVPTMDGFVADYINAFHARWAACPSTRSTRRSWPATRLSRCRCSRRIAKGSRPSITGSARCPRRRSPTAPSTTPRRRRDLSSTRPYDSFPPHNDAETIFERLEAAGPVLARLRRSAACVSRSRA